MPKPLKSERPSNTSIPMSLVRGNAYAETYTRIDLLDDIAELKQQLREEGVKVDHMLLPSVETADIETLELIKKLLNRKVRKV